MLPAPGAYRLASHPLPDGESLRGSVRDAFLAPDDTDLRRTSVLARLDDLNDADAQPVREHLPGLVAGRPPARRRVLRHARPCPSPVRALVDVSRHRSRTR